MNLRGLEPLDQEEAGGEGEWPQEGGEEATNPEAGDDVGEAVGLYGVNISQNLKIRISFRR